MNGAGLSGGGDIPLALRLHEWEWTERGALAGLALLSTVWTRTAAEPNVAYKDWEV